MVLELKEYTMASLGYKSSENPLISPNQTRPSPFFFLKTSDPPLHFHFLLLPHFPHRLPSLSGTPSVLLPSHQTLPPSTSLPLWPIDGGGGQSWLDRRGSLQLPLFFFFHFVRLSLFFLRPQATAAIGDGGGSRRFSRGWG